jgi:hypothetical protein
MPKFTESQIKAAISAREKETRADSKLRKTMLARMQAMRRQGEKALTSYLKKTEFDFKAYDRIRAQQQAEMHRLLKEVQKAAIKRSSSRKKDSRTALRTGARTSNGFATPPSCPHSYLPLRSWILPS